MLRITRAGRVREHEAFYAALGHPPRMGGYFPPREALVKVRATLRGDSKDSANAAENKPSGVSWHLRLGQSIDFAVWHLGYYFHLLDKTPKSRTQYESPSGTKRLP